MADGPPQFAGEITHEGDVLPPPPPMPPRTSEEIAKIAEISRRIQELTKIVRQQNLDHAVSLAQQATCGRGPLVDHFAELGRRFAHIVDKPPKPPLRVIKGDNGR